MVLLQNGEVANTGVGAAVQGSPATSIAWLANRLADYDITLKLEKLSFLVHFRYGCCESRRQFHSKICSYRTS